MHIHKFLAPVLLAALPALAMAGAANAQAIRDAGEFTTVFPANDDLSVPGVAMGFNINFYGVNFNTLAVNNNGNVTFDGPLGQFTPETLTDNDRAILAPFFADIDTRGAGSSLTTYGQSMIGGRNVFGVNWIDVGYFPSQDDKLNSIQLIITDRSDIAAGDFDFEFNYDGILWETGSASGGVNGFGGTSAAAGWSNGLGTMAMGGVSFQLPGSLVNGGLLDSNLATGLVNNSLNSNLDGRYIFNVRSGMVMPPPDAIPEPATWAMLIAGFGLAGAAIRRRAVRGVVVYA